MRKVTFTLFTLLGVSALFAQKASIEGPVLQSASFNPLNLEKVTMVCDTVSNIEGSNDTLTYYSVGAANGGGYVSGHNGYGDLAKAEFFSYTGGPATIPAVAILFAVGKAGTTPNTFNVKVWADSAGTVGTELASTSLTYAQVKEDVDSSRTTMVAFPTPVAVMGSFYVGIEFTYAAGDTVAMVTNKSGNTPSPGTAWEKWSDGSWYAYSSSSSWGLELSHLIFRVLCTESVSINDGLLGQFNLFPNPNTGTFSLEVRNAESKNAVMTVTNVQGQVVYTENLDFTSGSLSKNVDLGALANGLYIVNIASEGKVSNHKLVIQN